MKTEVIESLIELRTILTDKRNEQRKQTNKLSARIRELDAMLTPDLLQQVAEAERVRKEWDLKPTPKKEPPTELVCHTDSPTAQVYRRLRLQVNGAPVEKK